MFKTLIFSGLFAVLCPLLLFFFLPTRLRRSAFALYIAGILFLTVGNRLLTAAMGLRFFFAVRQIDLTLFWSYARFDQADIRWQVYMNVFLFLPFGFMLPWTSVRLQRWWKVLLIAAVFSALTEAAQYFLRIGLCETDDVIHNTLGAVIGYGYWRLLCRIQAHFRGDKK